MHMGGVVYLILFEPLRDAVWIDPCWICRVIQLDERISQSVPFSLTDLGNVSSYSISKSHPKHPFRTAMRRLRSGARLDGRRHRFPAPLPTGYTACVVVSLPLPSSCHYLAGDNVVAESRPG